MALPSYCQYLDRYVLSSGYSNITPSQIGGEWILGELFMGLLSDGNLSIHQGFLHDHSITTSTVSNSRESVVHFYPNPCLQFIQVSHSFRQPMEIMIYSPYGDYVKRISNPAVEFEIDLQDLVAGIYLFNVRVRGHPVAWYPIFKIN